ncbi:MAG: fibronectin type III domain-containing protein [Brumimicrobium sp.]
MKTFYFNFNVVRTSLFGLLMFCFGTLTFGQISTFPYSEGFEGGNIPAGWTQEYESGTVDWQIVAANGSGNVSPRTGTGMAEFRTGTSGNSTKLVTPQLDITSLANPELSFYFANENWFGDIDELRVYYKASATDSWTQIGQSYTTEHASWTEVSLNLPDASADYYIAFEGTSNWAHGLDIDDVEVREGPTCPQPSALAQTAITTSSVDVNWTENGSATTWNVEVGPTGFTPGTSTEVVADNGNTTQASSLSGLSGNTSYDIYVQADCGPGDQSFWEGPLTITTPPAAQIPVSTFPWNEDFETGGSEWTILNGSQTNQWFVGSAINNGGSNAMYVTNDGGATYAYTNNSTSRSFAYRDITMPATYLEAKLSFDWQADAETSFDNLIVWALPIDSIPAPGTALSASGTAPTGVINLTGNLSENVPFQNESFSIPDEYAGETFRLVFQWKNDGSFGQQPPAAVDNISIQTFNCNAPYDLASSDEGKFGATVSWNDSISAPSFNVEYGPAGFTPGTGTTVNVADTFAVLTGLISDQDYDYYVSGECSDATFSSQVKGSFTTLVACAVPTSFALVEKTESSVELTWMVPVGGASTFTVEYGPAGFALGTGITVTAPPTVITGLDSDTEYDFYVIAECGGTDGPSQPAGPVTVTTDIACEQPTNIVVSDIESNSVVITWDGHSATNWVIEYDTLGFTQGSSVNAEVNTSTIPHTLTGLDPAATYSIYVWADCGVGGTSLISGPVSFTTLPPCAAPTNLTVSDIGADTAVVAWDANGTTNWVIEFDTLGFTPGNGNSTIENTTDNPFTLTGLSPEQTYDVYVWADCGTDGLSDTLGPINFTTQPVCPAPTNLTVSDIGADTAVVAWDAHGTTNWVIEFDTLGFTPGNGTSTIENTTDNPFTLTGLSPEQTYDVYVWADCGTDGLSDTLGPINFTTQPTCLAPTGLMATVNSSTTADLGWTENGSATEWQVQYGPAGFTLGSGNIESATANPHPITGLTGNTDYGFYVRSVCAVGDTSAWAGPFAFDTRYCGVSTSYGEYLTSIVSSGAITNISYSASSQPAGSYADETTQTFEAYEGQVFDINTNYSDGSNGVKIWVDWNNNLQFDEPAELVDYQFGSGGQRLLTFTVPSGTPQGDYRVRIRGRWSSTANPSACGNESWGSTVDFNLTVVATPTCFPPSDVVVSNITTTSADVAWTNNNASTTWNIEYGPVGFTPGSGTTVNGVTNPYTITGLSDTTSYEVRVQSDCGSGDLSYWANQQFTTEPNPIPALGFCEDFNVGSPTVDLWTILDNNNDGEVWNLWNYTTDPDNKFMGFDTYWNTNDDYLISPAITLTGVEALNFAYRVYDSYTVYPTEFQVLLSTTGKNPADFTDTLMDLAAYSNEVFLDTSIDLSSYTGDVYIAFNIPPSAGDNSVIFIEDVCFGVCVPSTGTDGTVEVCRLDGAIDLTDGIITHDNDFGRWAYPANQALIQDDTMFAIGTLPAGAHEVLYIVDGFCYNSSDTTVAVVNVFNQSSAGNGGSITVCAGAPINLYAALSGNVDMGGDWYDYNGNLLGTSQPTAPSLGASYNYMYITSNGVCDADTAFVEVVVDASPDCTSNIQEEMAVNLSVYPNPTTDVLHIVNPTNIAALKVEVLDMNGRIVLVENSALKNTTEATISLGNLNTGVYTLRVYNEEGQKIFKVVKR